MRFFLLLLPFLLFSVSSPQSFGFGEGTDPESGKNDNYQKPFEVFPNPAQQYFSLKSDYFSQVSTEMSIFDVSGKLVVKHNELSFDEENISHIDISFLSSGLYFIKLRTGNYSATKKIFKL